MTSIDIVSLTGESERVIGTVASGPDGTLTGEQGVLAIVESAMKRVRATDLGALDGWSNGYISARKTPGKMIRESEDSSGSPVAEADSGWREQDHPRDQYGQFTDKPGGAAVGALSAGDRITLPDGGGGHVVAMIGDDRVAVQRDDGGRKVVNLADLQTGDGAAKPEPFDPESYYDLPDPKITDAENRSVMFYRGNGYQEINRMLRENEGDAEAVDDPEIRRHIANLDWAISKNRLDRDLSVYRGMSSSYARDLVPGAELEVSAYSSTSMSREKADEFAAGGALMQIDLPKGTNELKAFDGDFEILLARGAVLVVDRVENGVVFVRPE